MVPGRGGERAPEDRAEGEDPSSRRREVGADQGAQATAIAHDLNNLLAVMISNVEAALNAPETSEMRACLEDVLGAAALAARLTKQLTHLGGEAAASGQVDLNGVIEQLADVLRANLGAGIRLDLHTWHRPLMVRMSGTDLERVLLNLAGNARHAMPHGGVLRLEARPFVGGSSANPYALLVVADSGCGMDPATAARVFEPFFTTKPGEGRGLGLAIVHRLITSSGGHIHVESEPGKGAVFRLLLSQDPSADPAPPEDRGAAP
jgi:two-component system cell cycle sensor histidine kinase/response regulator CckA